MTTTPPIPPAEPPLTDRERKRRVLILALAFARNMSFYRGAWGMGKYRGPGTQFWITANGNFIDIATLEWCKLFADKKGKHHWRKVVTDHAKFQADMLAHVGISDAEFDELVAGVTTYRDKFIAHLDDTRTMNPPALHHMWHAVRFLFQHVLTAEMTPAEAAEVRRGLRAAGLPTIIVDYQADREAEARGEYAKAVKP